MKHPDARSLLISIISDLVEGKLWSSFSKRLLKIEGFKEPRGQGFQ
jgi:hypothetical protein